VSSSVLVANHVDAAAGAAPPAAAGTPPFIPITESTPPASDGPVAFPSAADAAARFLNPETAASTKETSSTTALSSAALGMEGGGTTDGMIDCACFKDEGFDMALIPWYVHSPAAVKARSDPARKRKKESLSPFLLLLLPISVETRVLLLSVSCWIWQKGKVIIHGKNRDGLSM
jgi:hypothetical protein